VWFGLALAIVGIIYLAQPLLLIFAGIVLAAMLDGGARLLGRVLPIGRGWRLAIVTVLSLGFLIWTFVFAGQTIASEAEALRTVLTTQVNKLLAWGNSLGIVQGGAGIDQLGGQLMGSLGRLGTAVSSALGAVTSLAMILVLGIFFAIEPRLYERGVAWMLPMRSREPFYRTAAHMGYTMRRLMAGRLLGMAVEGVGTWILLWIGGVPMAALLGLLTGLLAFIPNIGAIVSGVLIVLAGFSVGTDAGLWAIGVYVVVQIVDGYLIVPYVARKTVDLAPALVLGAQLLFGALFGSWACARRPDRRANDQDRARARKGASLRQRLGSSIGEPSTSSTLSAAPGGRSGPRLSVTKRRASRRAGRFADVAEAYRGEGR
jgi:predicted PurR-regulated permease PerM